MYIDRIYWLNADPHHKQRARMQTGLMCTKRTNVRVPAFDANLHMAGDTLRASCASHFMLYERLVEDKINRVVLVLEDTVSFELTSYWTTSLDSVAKHAPDDWGIIQLAYRCDDQTIARVYPTLSPKEKLYTSDCFYVEKRVFLDEHSPYVPWSRWHASLACAYLIHPRAYKTLVKKGRQTPFSFDRPVEEVFFPLVNTYTFHRPLFTVQLDTRSYPYDDSRLIYERHTRLIRLVKEWHRRWHRALQQKKDMNSR